MSDLRSAKEVCSCGASIEVTGRYSSDVRDRLVEFRGMHKHETPSPWTPYGGAGSANRTLSPLAGNDERGRLNDQGRWVHEEESE